MVPELVHLTRTSLWLELPVSTQRSPRERHRELTVLPRGPPRRSESVVVGANLGCLCEGRIFCPCSAARLRGLGPWAGGLLQRGRCGQPGARGERCFVSTFGETGSCR